MTITKEKREKKKKRKVGEKDKRTWKEIDASYKRVGLLQIMTLLINGFYTILRNIADACLLYEQSNGEREMATQTIIGWLTWNGTWLRDTVSACVLVCTQNISVEKQGSK